MINDKENMTDFRKISPQRRSNPSIQSNYRKYKLELREDFHQRCGYCGDHDFFRQTYYEIDHFVPKSIDKKHINDYSNLVYSCRSCNNAKRDRWPTSNSNISNDKQKGWIDPCDSLFSNQFERMEDGSIRAITELGFWMWTALGLGNPKHRLIWQLEKLRILLDEADKMNITDTIEQEKINELNKKYRRFEEELKGIPNFK